MDKITAYTTEIAGSVVTYIGRGPRVITGLGISGKKTTT